MRKVWNVHSQKIVKNGKDYHQDGKAIQNY